MNITYSVSMEAALYYLTKYVLSPNKQQIVFLYSISFTLQMLNAIAIGPSLLDLQLRTNSTIEEISWVVSAVALGDIPGSLLIGRSIMCNSSNSDKILVI